jgi:hypothetical protein
MFRRDGDVFLLGTAMAAKLLQNVLPESFNTGAQGAGMFRGRAGKASRGVNRKP